MSTTEIQSSAKNKNAARKKDMVRHAKTSGDTVTSTDRSGSRRDIKPGNTLFSPDLISGRRKTDQADLYDLVPVAYITLDAEGYIEKLNQAATKLLAGKSPSICGKQLKAMRCG